MLKNIQGQACLCVYCRHSIYRLTKLQWLIDELSQGRELYEPVGFSEPESRSIHSVPDSLLTKRTTNSRKVEENTQTSATTVYSFIFFSYQPIKNKIHIFYYGTHPNKQL